MSEVTSPILTDATGQEIVSKLNTLLTKMDNLAAAFQPNASGIVYSNTTSGLTGDDVQEAIDEVAGDVSEINSALSNLVKSTTVSGTTTSSGAIAIPNELKNKPLIDIYYDSANGLVFRRDSDYLTCLALSLQPFSNTSVSITIWYLDV